MKTFNLIGGNTTNSLSPYIYNFIFNSLKISAQYNTINIDRKFNFNKIIKKIRLGFLEGINVTNPHKISIMKDLDILDSVAKHIGATNCIALNQNNKVCGYNTDWVGFTQMVTNYKINFNNKKIKIIGYGGAALAVKYALEGMGFSKIEFYNRKKIGFDILDLPKSLDEQSVVINATPYHFIENDSLIFDKIKTIKLVWIDLLYTNLSTEKEKEIDKNRYFYGLDMLIYQALASIDIWFRKNISKNVDLNGLKLYLKEVIDA